MVFALFSHRHNHELWNSRLEIQTINILFNLGIPKLSLHIWIRIQSLELRTSRPLPSGFVKDVARPDYWVPDQDIAQCHQCSKTFTPIMSKHHCRACGQGVCGECSTRVKPVPSRGWDHPVRVCDGCHARTDVL